MPTLYKAFRLGPLFLSTVLVKIERYKLTFYAALLLFLMPFKVSFYSIQIK